MRLSKLKKLDPSAIDKYAMVFFPPLRTIAQLTNVRSIHSGFYQSRIIEDNKKNVYFAFGN
jgi:hypothetical protein